MKREKQQIFEQEDIILQNAKKILAQQDTISAQQLTADYQALADSYEQLLGEVKLLTSVSDRFQLKLNKANESIERKNAELKETIEKFSDAKISKETSYLLFGILAFLILISEGLLDPYILKNSGSYALMFLIKLSMLALLFPLKKWIRHILSKTALSQK